MQPRLSDGEPRDPPRVTESAREQAALAWLLSFADQERGVGWNPSASADEQWKLGRTRTLLDLAGAPDRRLVCVLIAGTKGKGSTAALLASILHAAGIRAGLYTQPHLQTFRERIRVDGALLPPPAFAAAVERFQGHVAALRQRYPAAGEPTTFELTTALAVHVFARLACRVAVMEVGLGGRLDATNALDPAVSVITPISRDHVAILGSTLAAIATEKAGILRPGRPALLAEQRPTAARALARACRHLAARCRVVPPLPGTLHPGAWRQWVAVGSETNGAGAGVAPREAPLRLLGDHQRQNAALAVGAARTLAAMGLPLDVRAIAQGLAQARWPGRFEVLPGPPTVVLDGAHNDASARALAQTLATYAGGRPLSLVVGINRDKDLRGVLRPLLAGAASVWCTRAAGRARAADPALLAAVCTELGARDVRVAPTVAEAVSAARAEAPADGVVCVTGSLAVVGQARDALGIPPDEWLWERERAATDAAAGAPRA